MAKFRIFYRT